MQDIQNFPPHLNPNSGVDFLLRIILKDNKLNKMIVGLKGWRKE